MLQRLVVIDAVRGFCLLNIFVNHITLGAMKEISVSKLALCDTAEVFVFLAGISIFLFSERHSATLGSRLLRRAAKLYLVNIAVILCTIVVLFLIDRLNGPSEVLQADVIEIVSTREPAEVLSSILVFSQTYGYSSVLRLYVFLTLWSPLAIWLARRRFWYPLLPAALIWVGAGHFGLILRDRFTNDPISLTLLPWTLVLTCGIVFAAGMRQGVSLPRPNWLVTSALVLVLGYILVAVAVVPQWPAAQDWFQFRNESFWLGGSKTLQSPARLLHLMIFVYLFVVLRDAPVVRLFYAVTGDNPLCRLGRASLPVFAFGAIAAVVINEVIYLVARDHGLRSVQAIAAEVVLIAFSCAIMMALAYRQRGQTVSASWLGAGAVRPAGASGA